jgi:hypothetical protein
MIAVFRAAPAGASSLGLPGHRARVSRSGWRSMRSPPGPAAAIWLHVVQPSSTQPGARAIVFRDED